MNELAEITDEEFVPFLHSLGVETYQMSFEWMLNDPDFSGVLRWLYNNLDQKNALSAREEYRYNEIVKHDRLLSPNELETSIASIQEEYPGICLPGDQAAVEGVKADIGAMQDRLAVLQKQKTVLKDLIGTNDQILEQLSLDITKLHSTQRQFKEDEEMAAEECIKLAEEMETLMDGVVDTVANTLEVYENTCIDKNIAKNFFVFGPLDSYKQTQALFRSHFDLFTSRRSATRNADNVTDEELRQMLMEAEGTEERLNDAVRLYVESASALSGERAKLALALNYSNVHPTQVTSQTLETRSSLHMMEREECVVEQQVLQHVQGYVKTRTQLAVQFAAHSALQLREAVHNDLCQLFETSQQALSLDRVVYCGLRHELRNLQEFLQFAAHLRHYVTENGEAVAARIESMNQICAEQETCEKRLQNTDPLVQFLLKLLGSNSTDVNQIVKLYGDLNTNIEELENSIFEMYKTKQMAIDEWKLSARPLVEYVWDGCTKQANCTDRTVASLSYRLRQQMALLDQKVLQATGNFASVKNGDKQNLRKLWQWFLTDLSRLVAALKGLHSGNCS